MVALIVIVVLVAVAIVGGIPALIKLCYVVIPTSELGVFTGPFGNKIVTGKGALRIPGLMECHRISIEPFGFETLLDDIPTSDFILLKMDLQVQVKFGTTDEAHRAIARLWMAAGARERLQSQVKELVAGYLRNAAADLKLEDLNTKRDDLQDKVLEAMASDLATMGVELASLTIQKITDASSGASAFEQLGRPSRAALKRSAEIAEAEASRESTEKRAIAETAAAQAKATSDREIAEAEHALEVRRAQLRATALAEAAKAEQAGALAKEEARLEVERKRALVAAQTAEADMLAPARAEAERTVIEAKAAREAAIETAEAEAQTTRIQAQADKEKQLALAEGEKALALVRNGLSDQALMLLLFPQLMETLPVLMAEAVKPYGNIDHLMVVQGDTGGFAQSAPIALAQIAEMMKALGVDVNFGELLSRIRDAAARHGQNGHEAAADTALAASVTADESAQ